MEEKPEQNAAPGAAHASLSAVPSKEQKSSEEQRHTYILLNKPKEYICADPLTGLFPDKDEYEHRKTIRSLVFLKSIYEKDIYVVAPLSFESEGLILLTSNKEMAERIKRSTRIHFLFKMQIDSMLKKRDCIDMENGFRIDKRHLMPWKIKFKSERRTQLNLTVTEKDDHFIYSVFRSLGYDILFLERMSFGILQRKLLPRGKWRFLNEQEVVYLNRL